VIVATELNSREISQPGFRAVERRKQLRKRSSTEKSAAEITHSDKAKLSATSRDNNRASSSQQQGHWRDINGCCQIGSGLKPNREERGRTTRTTKLSLLTQEPFRDLGPDPCNIEEGEQNPNTLKVCDEKAVGKESRTCGPLSNG